MEIDFRPLVAELEEKIAQIEEARFPKENSREVYEAFRSWREQAMIWCREDDDCPSYVYLCKGKKAS